MVYYSFTECFKLKLRTIWNPYVGWRVGLENELKSGGPNQTALQVFCLLLSRLQFCGASFMALFGKWQDLRNFGGIDDIRQHFNVADNVWAAFTGVVGDFNNDLRILAAFPWPSRGLQPGNLFRWSPCSTQCKQLRSGWFGA